MRIVPSARSMVIALAVVSATGLVGHPAPAQRGPHIELRLPARPNVEGPTIATFDVLADAQLRDLLINGFPARLHYRIELWSSGRFFDDLKGQSEWDVIVRYDPLDKRYRVNRLVANEVSLIAAVVEADAADRALAEPQRAALAPRGRGRYYYSAVVDAEVLSLTDLDEVERWLRGELTPAVRGERNAGTVLTRGVRSLFVRVIGGERRHFETRSATFRAD
ncbi:MAG: hypothetical protein NVS4B3_22080 [Gemmatimonadaceae bacterium]